MPEINEMSLNHDELLKLLIKYNEVHEGIWGLSFAFGIGVGNFGPDPKNIFPGATVTVNQIGIKRVPHGESLDSPGTVAADAAIVNPKKSVAPKSKKGTKT